MRHVPRQRVALVGAGQWGRNLARELHALGALHTVVELDRDARAVVGAAYPDVSVSASLDAALGAEIDAVVVATPVPTHAAVAREALESGKDVLVEKPLALRLSEASALRDLAATRGRVLMVGHLLLFQPAITWMKRALAEGKIGRLLSLHQERLNLGRVREGESALWSLGTHDVAVALYLTDRSPVRVVGHGQRALGRSVEDDSYVHLEFENGVFAHLHASWLWPEKRRRLTVLGSEGMLVYDEISQSVTLHRKRVLADATTSDEGEEIVFNGAGNPLRLELEHFLECVRSRGEPIASASSGVDTVRVLELASSPKLTPWEEAA